MINIIDTNIEDVKIIDPQIHNDNRGYFFESYNKEEFFQKIGKINFIQDNESSSFFGILRGIHYQMPPFEQSKLVRVISGEIQDIAVDIRKDSPTYLKYVSVIFCAVRSLAPVRKPVPKRRDPLNGIPQTFPIVLGNSHASFENTMFSTV